MNPTDDTQCLLGTEYATLLADLAGYATSSLVHFDLILVDGGSAVDPQREANAIQDLETSAFSSKRRRLFGITQSRTVHDDKLLLLQIATPSKVVVWAFRHSQTLTLPLKELLSGSRNFFLCGGNGNDFKAYSKLSVNIHGLTDVQIDPAFWDLIASTGPIAGTVLSPDWNSSSIAAAATPLFGLQRPRIGIPLTGEPFPGRFVAHEAYGAILALVVGLIDRLPSGQDHQLYVAFFGLDTHNFLASIITFVDSLPQPDACYYASQPGLHLSTFRDEVSVVPSILQYLGTSCATGWSAELRTYISYHPSAVLLDKCYPSGGHWIHKASLIEPGFFSIDFTCRAASEVSAKDGAHACLYTHIESYFGTLSSGVLTAEHTLACAAISTGRNHIDLLHAYSLSPRKLNVFTIAHCGDALVVPLYTSSDRSGTWHTVIARKRGGFTDADAVGCFLAFTSRLVGSATRLLTFSLSPSDSDPLIVELSGTLGDWISQLRDPGPTGSVRQRYPCVKYSSVPAALRCPAQPQYWSVEQMATITVPPTNDFAHRSHSVRVA